MPSVPSNGFQLAVLLVLLVPGIVYQFVRTRLRGPAADDQSAVNRVLRALGMSCVLSLVYVWLLAPDLVTTMDTAAAVAAKGSDPGLRDLAGWALLLLFVVPAVLAILVFYIPRAVRRLVRDKWNLSWRLTYDPVPRAWDFAFWDRDPCFVRILTADGTYVGGWYGPDSFASSFPEPRELYVQAAFLLEEDGTFSCPVEGTAGIYIRCDDIRLVEFVDAPSGLPDDAEEGGVHAK